jgi:RNA polymerase sigma-70 factor (ECF subfamily)
MAFSKKGKEKAAQAAVSVAPSAIEDLETTKLYAEDPLEALLDEQSDEEFGDLKLKERAGKPVKLAEWSAQDFSSIYLRFRPHLERHARRFLNNPSQVDEVVQDAFLYLMVSLPELDSEIGVLRFLKWKTRLLALDVIRASGRAYINSIDDVQEPASDDPEVSSSLEQQDDAAVVKLALSKLNPRHREVLIASMYEEKSTEQIAAQVGLSENATRQLIFRARAAFKKALIGDVDTTGMSAAAILSVAARKAAAEGKKVGAAALTLIALVVMSLTVFPGLNRVPSDQMAEAPAPGTSQEAGQSGEAGQEGPIEIAPTPDAGIVDDGVIADVDESEAAPASGVDEPEAASAAPDTSANNADTSPKRRTADPVKAVLDKPLTSGLVSSDSRTEFLVLDQNYGAFGDNGLTASFTFNPTSNEPFSSVKARITLEYYNFNFEPVNLVQISGKNSNGSDVFLLVGDATYLFDEFGRKWSETELGKSRIKIEVVMEANGVSVKTIDLVLLPAQLKP